MAISDDNIYNMEINKCIFLNISAYLAGGVIFIKNYQLIIF